MTVIPFPRAERVEIVDPADIAEIERMLAGVAGLMGATGGMLALAGVDLYALTVAERIAALAPMYDAGEIVFGYRDGRSGEVVNIVLERLSVGGRAGWRAEIYVEDAGGHALRGVIAEPETAALCARLTAAIGDGLRAPLPGPAALARLGLG